MLLPVTLLQEINLFVGDSLSAWSDDDRLALERPSTALEKSKAHFAGLLHCVSLADQMIAERREQEE